MIKATVKWIDGRQFLGIGRNSGHSVTIDTPSDKKSEDVGLRPTEMLLLGTAGCTAVDAVNILSKMKVDLTKVEVNIEGEQQEDYPKYFNKIKIKYTLSGEGLTQKKAEKAVSLSMNKYCAVSQTLKGRAEFETEIELI